MLFIPAIHMAAPKAPQPPPHKPMPPANPAAITVCMSDTPIFLAIIAAQPTDQEVEAWFEVGLVLDRRGEAPQAFEAFQKANSLQKQSPAAQRVDGGRTLKRVTTNQQWFTSERIQAMLLGDDGEKRVPPIFFVGFPRSGTTLVERVLAAHPQIKTTEESSPLASLVSRMRRQDDYPDVLGKLGKEALKLARSDFWADAERAHGSLLGRQLVDKLPLNIVELGLAKRSATPPTPIEVFSRSSIPRRNLRPHSPNFDFIRPLPDRQGTAWRAASQGS